MREDSFHLNSHRTEQYQYFHQSHLGVDVPTVHLRSVKPLEHYSKGLKVRVLSKPFLLRTTTSDHGYERCKAIIGEHSDVQYKTHNCLHKVENTVNEGDNVRRVLWRGREYECSLVTYYESCAKFLRTIRILVLSLQTCHIYRKSLN